MTIERAIKLAIEEGWDGGGFTYEYEEWEMTHHAFLDPLFWQSLGKAMGWRMIIGEYNEEWKYVWHSFIDHLAEGKSPEEFFENLKQ